jgi:hemerythrin-like domain-containing protein
MKYTRRQISISGAQALCTGLVTMGLPRVALGDDEKTANKIGVGDVSPVEDLMREHGGLNRILLIYDEGLQRLRSKSELDPTLIQKSAKLIQSFIEGYHEKLEEEYIFPRLKKAGKLNDLVDALLSQHVAGRKLTQTIITLSTVTRMKNTSDKGKLKDALTKFIRMYRPHEAREDTILFPAFKTMVTRRDYDQLGDQFEDKEHQLFGKEGFEGIIAQIAEIEKALGIYDLSNFTPRPT